MKVKIATVFVIFIGLFAFSPGVVALTQIDTVQELQDMELDLSENYELIADIDASATSGWNGGLGFDPVGTFTGVFEGNGFTISNLYINDPTDNNVGLFSLTSSATIRNVGLEDIYVQGNDRVGGLIGSVSNTTIRNCSVSGVVGAESRVGGFIGVGTSGTDIENCWASADVTGGTGSLDRYIGGFVGDLVGGLITNSYARGDASGGEIGAGLVGGFAGSLGGNGASFCYSTGLVTSSSTFVGGFSGINSLVRENNFWDNEASGQSTSPGSGSFDALGKSTADMKIQVTFTDNGWDFENIWSISSEINDGYPYLLGVIPPTPVPPAAEYENIDLWDDMTEPYKSLFPSGSENLFYVFLVGVTTLGVYMKTHSAGAVTITMLIFGLLVSGIIPGAGAWLFRVVIAVAAAILLYLLFKSR